MAQQTEQRNYAYIVGGVFHVACRECLPSATWRMDVGIVLEPTDKPCEYCGHVGPRIMPHLRRGRSYQCYCI